MDKTTLETHDYDTRLTKVMTTKKDVSNEEFKKFIKCLTEINNFLNQDCSLKIQSKINAQKTLHLLANDRQNNYDERNKIHTELLLPIIWNKIKSYNELTMYDIFVEQLNDIITSGPCAQGRTTRLIQLLSI
tara:strand:+ start:98 stop:493 length:396 start_codon:yes stop_codon:yes gene_type:complete